MVGATLLLTSCGEKPQNFSCSPYDAPRIANSLSITKNEAKLNGAEYKNLCRKRGNVLVYGLGKADCDSFNSDKYIGGYSVLVFDEVIFKTTTTFQPEKDSYVHEYYKCEKMN